MSEFGIKSNVWRRRRQRQRERDGLAILTSELQGGSELDWVGPEAKARPARVELAS